MNDFVERVVEIAIKLHEYDKHKELNNAIKIRESLRYELTLLCKLEIIEDIINAQSSDDLENTLKTKLDRSFRRWKLAVYRLEKHKEIKLLYNDGLKNYVLFDPEMFDLFHDCGFSVEESASGEMIINRIY
jgi:hypothetical protein